MILAILCRANLITMGWSIFFMHSFASCTPILRRVAVLNVLLMCLLHLSCWFIETYKSSISSFCDLDMKYLPEVHVLTENAPCLVTLTTAPKLWGQVLMPQNRELKWILAPSSCFPRVWCHSSPRKGEACHQQSSVVLGALSSLWPGKFFWRGSCSSSHPLPTSWEKPKGDTGKQENKPSLPSSLSFLPL